MAALFAVAASAQEQRSEVGVQGIGLFTSNWSGTNIVGGSMSATSSDAGGALLSYRYSFKRWLAAEGTYSFASNTEHFSTSTGNFGGRVTEQALMAGAVFSAPTIKRFRMTPYAMLDLGTIRFGPNTSEFFTDFSPVHQSRGVIAYGGGARFPLAKRLSLVAEFREFRYVAPDFSLRSIKSGILIHSMQPSAGIAFRF
jgi:hypothetical protein